MSEYLRCETCGALPKWTLERVGDAVITWSCADHLDGIAQRLQRSWETTKLVINLTPGDFERPV